MKSYDETMKDLAKENLEIWKKVCIAEDGDGVSEWKCDYRYCKDKKEFKKYLEDLKKEDLFPSEKECFFEGAGYYDCNIQSDITYLVADEKEIHTDEILHEIEAMDTPIRIIQARTMSPQIKVYIEEYEKLEKREYTIEIKLDLNEGHLYLEMDRLDKFLRELRKHGFIFHDEINYKNYFYGGKADFKITVYTEAEKLDIVEQIVKYYKLKLENEMVFRG